MEIVEITRIGELNRAAFAPLIPEALYKRLARDPDLFALGALWGGVACGAIVCEVFLDSLEILSLHTLPDAPYYCAADLLEQIVALAGEEAAVGELSAEFCGESPKESDMLITAYRVCGFRVSTADMKHFSLSLHKLRQTPSLTDASTRESIRFLDSFSQTEWYMLNAFLKENPYSYIETPVSPQNLITKLSAVNVAGNGINGALLFNHPTGEGFSLALMVFKDKLAAASSLAMLGASLKRASNYDDETVVRISAISPESRRLIVKLADNAVLAERPAYRARRPAYSDYEAPKQYRDRAEMVMDILEGEDLV